jgi:hypothetical protein
MTSAKTGRRISCVGCSLAGEARATARAGVAAQRLAAPQHPVAASPLCRCRCVAGCRGSAARRHGCVRGGQRLVACRSVGLIRRLPFQRSQHDGRPRRCADRPHRLVIARGCRCRVCRCRTCGQQTQPGCHGCHPAALAPVPQAQPAAPHVGGAANGQGTPAVGDQLPSHAMNGSSSDSGSHSCGGAALPIDAATAAPVPAGGAAAAAAAASGPSPPLRRRNGRAERPGARCAASSGQPPALPQAAALLRPPSAPNPPASRPPSAASLLPQMRLGMSLAELQPVMAMRRLAAC